MLRACLFDLDNTLYPADSGITEALEVQMNAYVARLTGLSSADATALRRHYFVTYGTTLRGLQIHHHVDAEDYLETVHQLPIDDCIVPNPELVAAIEQLPIAKALFTNSPLEHAIRVLRRLGFTTLDMPIIDIRMMQFHPKPHPDAYQIALDVIGVPAHAVALFEDTLHNLAYAKTLGMQTVYINPDPDHPIPPYVDVCSPTARAALHAIIP